MNSYLKNGKYYNFDALCSIPRHGVIILRFAYYLMYV